MSTPDPRIVDPEAPTVDAAIAEPGSVLVELMEHCLAQLEAGQDVNRDALVADHPELESQIDACLASLQFIHRAVQPTEGMPARLADFRIVREIGRGGMGVVYEAEQISLKRQVALKVLRFGAVADPEAMKRFQREAETIASLHHTNIVPVFAVGVEKAIHYYAMQLIEGNSLREIAQGDASKPIPDKTIARWGLQAAEALAHAHERGVVHRDIKPSNLILGTDGRIWLTDFGLAKRLDDVTLSLCGALLGTPRYMSPEQASALRHPVDHRTDIYSLGATLYELVTGRPLFDSESPHVVISQILTTEPKPPREIAPHVPRDLETIILKCLCKDASKRYQQARELADDLRAFEEGRAIKARRVTVVERAGRWLKQNRRVLAATVTAVGITVALVVGSSQWWTLLDAARQAKLSLTVKDGPLIGEVLNADGTEAIPSFTVPNEQPVPIPEGEYHLRTVGRGALSKTGWLSLDRGPTRKIELENSRPKLYSNVALNGMSGYEFVDFGGGPDLIVLPESPSNSDFNDDKGRSKPHLLRRLAGATGKEIWSLDISQKSPALEELLPTAELRSQWWSSTVFGWKLANEPPLRVLQPLLDLDGDEVPDLVWRLHQGYSMFAVSGKTGRPLWWYHTQPVSGPNPESTPSIRRQMGNAALATIPQPDGSIMPIVVVLELEVQWNDMDSTPARLLALDARNKAPLWSTELPGKLQKLAVTPSSVSKPSQINLAVVGTANQLLTFDLRTGVAIGQPLTLPNPEPNGWPRYSAPRIVDVDSDGLPEVLLAQNEPNSQPLGLQVASLSANGLGADPERPNWQVAFDPRERQPHFVEHRDLNGDGIQEIILTSQRQDFECRVIDSRTGNDIWRRQRRSNVFAGRHSPVIVGDDLDQDGWREVFVASLDAEGDNPGVGMHDEGHALYVDCFSGKDGHSFWWTKMPITGKASAFLHPFTIAPRWWSQGLSGESALLITALVEQKFPRTQGLTFVVNARTGRFEEVASELAAVNLIDLNNDGRDDLIAAKLDPDGSSSHRIDEIDSEMQFFRTENPTGWRRFGTWKPLMDLDGDGLSELWQPYYRYGGRLPIISGRDGKQFADWGSYEQINDYIPITEPTLDLDGDSLTEVLIVKDQWMTIRQAGRLPSSHELGVSLISSGTRRKFWSAPEVARPQWSNVEQLTLMTSKPRWKDLDGDGQLEILVPYYWHMREPPTSKAQGRAQYGLVVLDVRNGRTKWQAVLKEEPSDQQPVWYQSEDWLKSLEYGDMNGDGVQDMLVSFAAAPWHSIWKRETFVQAISGRDGHLLWPEFHAHLYEPKNLTKEQEEAIQKNSALQQFISKKQGYLQTVLANVDGKPGDEVIRLDFFPAPQPDQPYLDGELVLSVLDGQSGAVTFEKRWPGMIHPYDDKLPHRLMALHRPDRDAIVIAKAKYDQHYNKPENNEDWLFVIPPQSASATNGETRELEVTEINPMQPSDQLNSLDLDHDGVDELVCIRTSNSAQRTAELVVSRGLKDVLWRYAFPAGSGIYRVQMTLLDSGKGLLVNAEATSYVFRSNGELLSQFDRPCDPRSISLGSDNWLSRWDANETPRLIVTDGSQTRSDLILPIDARGAFKSLAQSQKIATSNIADPRTQRQLPWLRQSVALAFGTMMIAATIGIWLMLIVPYRITRWSWRQRHRVWPLLGIALWLVPILWIAYTVRMLQVMNASGGRVALALGPELIVSIPLAFGWGFVWRSLRHGSRGNWLWLFTAMVVSTLSLVTIMLKIDASGMVATENYRWNDWYQILLPGACLGLWLYLVSYGIWCGVRRRLRRSGPAAVAVRSMGT